MNKIETRKGVVSNEELKAAFKSHFEIMRKHYDMQTLKTIDCATNQLVGISIKNGLVFNAVHRCKVAPQNIAGKVQIYKDYKTFIAGIQALPQIEREYFLLKLQERELFFKHEMRVSALLGDFSEARSNKQFAQACQVVFDSLKGKNKALEIVPER